ncbi:MAG: PfkB family carbohydrate kinase [Acidobacteria bacterium]|nr:PfkB family carbohydrate kinase [Acidobacteriota bacterium]MCL5287829.1 PfkB family carbohydrate kinase [Acidobacteriota bacterium]
MSLLVVGSVAFDAIQTPFREAERVLGGAAMYFAVAASFFTKVNVVGVVGYDFTARDAEIFRRRGIDTQGLERAPGKTFFWAGKYSADFTDRTTLATDLNVFATFNPKLPSAYRTSPYIFLANIDPTLQRSVLKQVSRRPKLVALDTMNYWIERTPAELRETLRHVDVLLINDTETRQLSGEHNLLRAAAKIRKMGPRTLVIKRGEFGALLVHGDTVFAIPGFLLDEVQDPTGAGDAYAGGFMGYLASVGKHDVKSLRCAMVYGSVLGSFTCERFGPERLRTLTRREIDARARHFAKLTQFSL